LSKARWPAFAVLLAGGLVSTLVLAVTVLIELAPGPPPRSAAIENLSSTLASWAFLGVGCLILLRRPGHGVGWALNFAGASLLVETLLIAYADLALYTEPTAGYRGGSVAAALSAPAWTGIMAGVFLLLVYFPTGAAGKAWDVVVQTCLGCYALIALAIIIAPTLQSPFDGLANPLSVDTGGLMETLRGIAIAVCMVSFIAAAGSLLLRFRRSRGEERQQHKWLALAASALVAALPYGFYGNFTGLSGGLMILALLATPIAVGIAVLRYRLYDFDRLISRGLAYGVLTASLAVTYAGLVLLLQFIFQPISGGSDLAIAATTIVVAAVFRPAQARIQRAMNHRFNRRSYDAASAVEQFAGRLRNNMDIDTLQAELRAVLEETVQPARVGLWLRAD